MSIEHKSVLSPAELTDEPQQWPARDHQVLARGGIADFVADQVTSPSDEVMARQYLLHPGAVGVFAMDDDGRVALVRQYRHAVLHRLVEPPAGLLDVADEDYLAAAQRELAEEVGVAAADWRVVVDLYTSPGTLSESLRIYLARGLSEVAAPDGFVKSGEEIHMDVVWAGLDDLVAAVLDGRLHNPTVVSGALALWAARTRDGLDALRPADAPWPAREDMLARQPWRTLT